MTQMVTRCPTCATAFRVTSTQLESAKGAVRCGSCLHIFQAQDYLVKTAEEEKPVPSRPVAVEPVKAQGKTEESNVEQTRPEPIKSGQVKAEQIKTEPAAAQPKPVMVQPNTAQSIAAQPVVAQPKLSPKPATEQKPVQQKDEPQAIKKPASPMASSVQPTSTAKIAVAKPVTHPATAPEKVIVKPVVIDKAKILADEDDVLISDDMEDRASEKPSTYEFDGFIDLDMHPKQTVSLFEREIRYEPPHDDDENDTTDESWAEGLLDDDGEPLHQFKKPVVIQSSEISSSSYSHEEKEDKSFEPKTSGSAYSGPVFSLVSENADENTEDTRGEPVLSEAFLAATRAPESVTPPSHFAELFDQEPQPPTDNEELEKASKRAVRSSKMRAFDTSRAALLMNIMPAPVEFTARRMRRYKRKLWPVLAVCMCLLLVFQIAYFKFDYFSRVEPYRTVYLFTCPLLGCEVPALVDTSQILATNLVVRNHPDTANALMVDAILINNAPFEQPFPDLILSFSKLDDTPVASRRFTPKDYIGGELAGMKYIPQRQPVHITLEITDPGPEAVNYTLATH